jgi:hypothetical protein
VKKLLPIAIATFFFLSCGTSKKVSIAQYATPTTEQVQIIGIGQQVPSEAVLLGSVNIGDTGLTTKCSYADVINEAIIQAQAMGGNILYIKQHKEPSTLGSSCHRIKCEVYKK